MINESIDFEAMVVYRSVNRRNDSCYVDKIMIEKFNKIFSASMAEFIALGEE